MGDPASRGFFYFLQLQWALKWDYKDGMENKQQGIGPSNRHNGPRIHWSNVRELLWAAGVFGILLFGFLLLMDSFFGGLDIDGRKPPAPPKTIASWLSNIAMVIVLVYYICATYFPWNRRWWRIGVAVHLVFAGIFIWTLLVGDRAIGLVLAPVGVALWLLYAKENRAFGN